MPEREINYSPVAWKTSLFEEPGFRLTLRLVPGPLFAGRRLHIIGKFRYRCSTL